MQPLDLLSLFFMASVLLAVTPGPDNLFVLAQAAQRGKVAGLAVTLGLCTGLLVHTGAVALGIAAIFKASTVAFSVLKYVGAGYLLFLAYKSFRSNTCERAGHKTKKLAFSTLYRRGIIMNITNPKVSLFFLAFLPQFTDPLYGTLVPQIVLLGVIFIIATALVFGSISLLAGAMGEKFQQSDSAQLILNRLAGTVFVALAVKLALAKR